MATRLHIEPGKDAEVTLEDGELFIVNFREGDSEVVGALEDLEDLEAGVHRLLGVGARAARLAQATLDTGIVEAKFEQMTGALDRTAAEFAGKIVTTAEDLLAEEGDLQGSLRSFKDEFAGLIEATFDPDNRRSALARLDELMKEAGDRQVAAVRRVLNPDDEESPLGRYRAEIIATVKEQGGVTMKALQELSEKVVVRRAEAEVFELTSVKGFSFEGQVHRVVGELAAPLGDLAEQVGNESGAAGGKVGDEVVTLNVEDTNGTEARYVIEAKDRKLTLRRTLAELGEAMENREAMASIMVFSRQELAPVPVPFQFCGSNRAIVVLDKDELDDRALRLGCMWARWVVRRGLVETLDGLDIDAVEQSIKEAKRAMDRASTIRRAHTTARKGIEQAGNEVGRLVEEVDAALAQIMDQLGR